MPLPLALLLLAGPQGEAMFSLKTAGDRLGPRCTEAPCIRPDSPFRLDREIGGATTMKDRAIRTDGSYCNVVGARRCTSHGRTLFHTDFTDR